MKLHVLHRTRHLYENSVRDSFNEVRLQPVTAGGQTCHNFLLKIIPPSKLSHYLDFHFNCVHLFEISQPHTELTIEANSVVTTNDTPVLTTDATPFPLEKINECVRMERCYDFLQSSTYIETGPDLWRMALDITDGQKDAWQAARAITGFINREFKYQSASTNVHTHMREVIQAKTGVCQDFAHVMIGLCRALKIPARYVTGYLYNGPADQLKGAQATHAWVEVYLPGPGWCGLDPTNNRTTDGHYVKVAVGRDFADTTPHKGTYRSGNAGKGKLTVHVLVTRTDDGPTIATAQSMEPVRGQR